MQAMRRFGRARRSGREGGSKDVLWGATALAIMLIAALIMATVYANPPGEQIVAFYTDDAASVRPGDEVRIAGITVGRVKDLALETDQVKVRAQVDRDAFVGDQSQIDIRMLTVVGGYYVNVVSLGDRRLGDKPIPTTRVKTPYNLMRILADTPKITEEIDARPVSQSLDQIQRALAGDNVEALAAVIDAGNTLVSTIERQRGQVTAILDLSDEYIDALTRYDEGLRQIVMKSSLLGEELRYYGTTFGESLYRIANVFDALAPAGDYYWTHRDDFLRVVRHYQENSRYWSERYGLLDRIIRWGRRKIERVAFTYSAGPPAFMPADPMMPIDIDDQRDAVMSTDLCIPVPGSAC